MTVPSKFVYMIVWILYHDLSSEARKNAPYRVRRVPIKSGFNFRQSWTKVHVAPTPYNHPRYNVELNLCIENSCCHLLFFQDCNSNIYNIPLTSINNFIATTKWFLIFSLVEIYVLWDRAKRVGYSEYIESWRELGFTSWNSQRLPKEQVLAKPVTAWPSEWDVPSSISRGDLKSLIRLLSFPCSLKLF